MKSKLALMYGINQSYKKPEPERKVNHHPPSKKTGMTYEKACELRRKIRAGKDGTGPAYNRSDAAREYGLSLTAVSDILTMKTWT